MKEYKSAEIKLDFNNKYKQDIVNLKDKYFDKYIKFEVTQKYIDFTKVADKDTRSILKCAFWYNLEVKNIPISRLIKWIARFTDFDDFIKIYYLDIYKLKDEDEISIEANLEKFYDSISYSYIVRKQFKDMVFDIYEYMKDKSNEAIYYRERTNVIESLNDINQHINQDIINLELEVFKKYRSKSTRAKYIDFTKISNPLTRAEFRKSFFYMLENKYLSLNRLYQISTAFGDIDFILESNYKNIGSLLNISKESIFYYIDEYSIGKSKNMHMRSIISLVYEYLNNINNINNKEFMLEETNNDIWKLENLAYVNIKPTDKTRTINFTKVNENFRDLSKRYISQMLKIYSVKYVSGEVLRGITIFLNYINSLHPSWTNLNKLNRIDMDKFFTYFNNEYGHLKKKNISYLRCIKNFIEYIQVSEYDESPTIQSDILINKYDIPKEYKLEIGEKDIPNEVLKQLDENLEFLSPSKYIPVITILLASGWRISDVLNLRYDKCLEKINNETYYLVGDIVKTGVKEHRVPIPSSVAEIIKQQIKISSDKSFTKINKNKLLFCTERGKRIGLPYDPSNIRRALNNLSKNRNIIYQGQIYHFKTHQFRHTKAVELIEKGMELVHVQRWLAHKTSNTTMHYAEVKADSLRKSWENCIDNGFYKFSDSNKYEIISANDCDVNIDVEYIVENKETINVGLGYCIKSKDEECLYSTAPCLSCRNLCVTQEFIEHYEYEIEKTKDLINTATTLNRQMLVEKNIFILNKLEEIWNKLKGNNFYQLRDKFI